MTAIIARFFLVFWNAAHRQPSPCRELSRLGNEHDWVVALLDELRAGSLRWPSAAARATFPGADD